MKKLILGIVGLSLVGCNAYQYEFENGLPKSLSGSYQFVTSNAGYSDIEKSSETEHLDKEGKVTKREKTSYKKKSYNRAADPDEESIGATKDLLGDFFQGVIERAAKGTKKGVVGF